MKRKPDSELTAEELQRRQTLRKRMFFVYIALIVALVIYLLFELFSIMKNK